MKRFIAGLTLVLLFTLLLVTWTAPAMADIRISVNKSLPVAMAGAIDSSSAADFESDGKDVVRFGESATIPRDKVVGSLVVFGGDATVDGTVGEAVVVFGGNATIAGTVGRDVVVFGGNVELKPTAHIKKDLVNFGGKVKREEGARVDGSEVFGPKFVPGFRIPDWFSSWFWFFQGTVVLIGLMALGALSVALLPNETTRLASTVAAEPWKSLGVGVLAVLAIPFVLLALLITLIGIPIIPFFILALPIIFLYSYIGAGRLIGQKIIELINGTADVPILSVVVGILVLGLVGFVPVLGDIIKVAAVLVGLGAVLTTKFGTGRPWRRSKVQPEAGANQDQTADA
ncbi:MAG: polymer-forming cytoskeletal protein [Actinobacteria bacterium]|nr:polymer-forming cytoskeletal protein [Actinomycetota bacterium]